MSIPMGHPAYEEVNKEGQCRDHLRQLHSMTQSVQNRLMACACRGNVNANMKAELLKEIDWLRREIFDIKC